MRKSVAVTSILIAAAATQAPAAQWNVSDNKGLSVHHLATENLRLTVVCDPNNAFSPPQDYIIIEFDGQRVEEGELTITRGDDTATVVVEGASVLPAGNEQGWNAATSMLFAGGPVTVSVGGAAALVDVQGLPSNCPVR